MKQKISISLAALFLMVSMAYALVGNALLFENETYYTAGTSIDTSASFYLGGATNASYTFASQGNTANTVWVVTEGNIGRNTAGTADRWVVMDRDTITGILATNDLRTPASSDVKIDRVRLIVSSLSTDSSAAITYSLMANWWGE